MYTIFVLVELLGVWMVGEFSSEQALGRLSRKSVEAARNCNFQQSDILLATYPKTGTKVN